MYIFLILFLFILVSSSSNIESMVNNTPWYSFEQALENDPGYTDYDRCMQQGYGGDFCAFTPAVNYQNKSKIWGLDTGYCNCGPGRSAYQVNNMCYCYIYKPEDGYDVLKTKRDYLNPDF